MSAAQMVTLQIYLVRKHDAPRLGLGALHIQPDQSMALALVTGPGTLSLLEDGNFPPAI